MVSKQASLLIISGRDCRHLGGEHHLCSYRVPSIQKPFFTLQPPFPPMLTTGRAQHIWAAPDTGPTDPQTLSTKMHKTALHPEADRLPQS